MQFSEERKWQRNEVTNWKLELFEYLRSSPFVMELFEAIGAGPQIEKFKGQLADLAKRGTEGA